MVMPLWDHDPFEWPTPPYVMWTLIVVNFGVFLWTAGLSPDDAEAVARTARRLAAVWPLGPVGVIATRISFAARLSVSAGASLTVPASCP